MKNIFVLFVLCLPFFLIGQSKVDFVGSLDYSYRFFGNKELSQVFQTSEKGKLNYHFGVNYNEQLKEKWWLKIGVGFVSTGYKFTLGTLRYGSQHDGNGNFDPTIPQGETFQIKYNFHFLTIPIALRHEFSNKKKLTPFVEVGISTMYYLQSYDRVNKFGEIEIRKERKSVINEFQFAPTLAFGFNYAFNEKWEMIFQPNFRYHLTKIANSPFKEHQWSGGVALGIRRTLKK